MHSDQFKPKFNLKLIKKYIFSEGEEFPVFGVMNDRVVVMMGGAAVGRKFGKLCLGFENGQGGGGLV